jgi:hypothetical protein
LRFVRSIQFAFLFLAFIVLDSFCCYFIVCILPALKKLVFLPLLLLRIYIFFYWRRGVWSLESQPWILRSFVVKSLNLPALFDIVFLLSTDTVVKHTSVIRFANAIVIGVGCNESCSFDCCRRLAELES